MFLESLLTKLKRWVAPAHPHAEGAEIATSAAGSRPIAPESKHAVTPEIAVTTLSSSPFREVLTLSWPIAAAMLGETAIGLVDTKLVSGLGADALGGVAVATMLMYLNYSLVMGMSRGVKVRTAHAVGRGAPEDGIQYAGAGIAIFAVVGVLVWLVSRDIGWVLRLIGVDPALHDSARVFLAARTYGAPATCVLAGLIQYRHAVGDTRSPMIIGIGGNIANALLAYGLIYGKFGLPALGVQGAGYGTAITEWIEMTTMLVLFVRDARAAKRKSALTFRTAVIEVCELGVPTGLHFAAETLAFTTFTAILAEMGSAQIAAHQVALAIIRVSFLPGLAVSEAASVLVGRSLGQRDLSLADKMTRASLVLAVSFMAVCGVLFAIFGGALARAFSNDPVIFELTRRLLLVAAVFQVLDAVNIVLRGALRGAKDVHAVAVIGISVSWICVPGLAFVLGKLAGWGAFGGWCGFIAETTASATLFAMRWKRGAWRREYSAAQPRISDAPVALETSLVG